MIPILIVIFVVFGLIKYFYHKVEREDHKLYSSNVPDPEEISGWKHGMRIKE